MAEIFQTKKWFKRWWGVTVIVLIAVFLIFVGIFGFITVRYWQTIRSGGGDVLSEKINRDFSFFDRANKAPDKVDRAVLENKNSPFLGRPNASLVIVEFIDFRCPNCLTAAPIIRQVAEKYGNKVKIIARNFPVESTHPGASELAAFAVCANAEGKYWSANQALFAVQDQLGERLTAENLETLADYVGLDLAKLKTCLISDKTRQVVEKDYFDGLKAGVRGTPTYFVNGQPAEGVISFEVWEKYINAQK